MVSGIPLVSSAAKTPSDHHRTPQNVLRLPLSVLPEMVTIVSVAGHLRYGRPSRGWPECWCRPGEVPDAGVKGRSCSSAEERAPAAGTGWAGRPADRSVAQLQRRVSAAAAPHSDPARSENRCHPTPPHTEKNIRACNPGPTPSDHTRVTD